MRLRHLILLITFGLLLIFAVINWQAIMAPTELSVIFTTINAPLGLILLIISGLLIVLFLSFVVYMQSSLLASRSRLTRDLEAQRELANQAEASRFTDLKAYLQSELQQLSQQNINLNSKTESRLNLLENTLTNHVEQTGTSLSAYIGELEDRLEKKF